MSAVFSERCLSMFSAQFRVASLNQSGLSEGVASGCTHWNRFTSSVNRLSLYGVKGPGMNREMIEFLTCSAEPLSPITCVKSQTASQNRAISFVLHSQSSSYVAKDNPNRVLTNLRNRFVGSLSALNGVYSSAGAIAGVLVSLLKGEFQGRGRIRRTWVHNLSQLVRGK